MKKISIISILIAFVLTPVFGQKLKVVSGDFSTLKGQTEVNVVYTYDELMVSKLTESEYIEKKMREYNEKEPGKGEKFKESWETSREKRYHPKFEELITAHSKKFKFGDYPDAEYTITVNSENIDPGYNIGISKKPAYLDCEIVLTDKSGSEKCRIKVFRAPGSQFSGYDYDAGTRIAECYAITGKRLGAMIAKATK